VPIEGKLSPLVVKKGLLLGWEKTLYLVLSETRVNYRLRLISRKEQRHEQKEKHPENSRNTFSIQAEPPELRL